MPETVGGVGIWNPYNRGGINPNVPRPTKNIDLFDYIKEKREKQQIVRKELRIKELENKKKNGELTQSESIELAYYKNRDFIGNLLTFEPKYSFIA